MEMHPAEMAGLSKKLVFLGIHIDSQSVLLRAKRAKHGKAHIYEPSIAFAVLINSNLTMP